ncbi:RNA polymerase alpha/RpoL/Rpb11 family protein [Candidatus Vidania fulgoroideorum]
MFKRIKLKKISLNNYKILILKIKKKIINDLLNSLKRIILSSIGGYGIKYYKLKGLKHQYCYIDGIIEDALEISLNLKKIIFKLNNIKNINIILIKKGPCDLDSSEFNVNNFCKVLNPGIKILTISSNINVKIEIKVTKGVGYNSNLEYKKFTQNNKIFIDTIFSPVISLNSTVRKNNAMISIETNGTISPFNVFIKAIKIFLNQFNFIKYL